MEIKHFVLSVLALFLLAFVSFYNLDRPSSILAAFAFVILSLFLIIMFIQERNKSVEFWNQLASELGEPVSEVVESISVSQQAFKYKGRVVSFSPRPLSDMFNEGAIPSTNLFIISCFSKNKVGLRMTVPVFSGSRKKLGAKLNLSAEAQAILKRLESGYFRVYTTYITYEPFYPGISKEYMRQVLDNLVLLADILEK